MNVMMMLKMFVSVSLFMFTVLNALLCPKLQLQCVVEALDC